MFCNGFLTTILSFLLCQYGRHFALALSVFGAENSTTPSFSTNSSIPSNMTVGTGPGWQCIISNMHYHEKTSSWSHTDQKGTVTAFISEKFASSAYSAYTLCDGHPRIDEVTRISTLTEFSITTTNTMKIPRPTCTVDSTECGQISAYRSSASSIWAEAVARGRLFPTTLSLGPSASFVVVDGSTSTLTSISEYRWPILKLGKSTYLGDKWAPSSWLWFKDASGSPTKSFTAARETGPAYTINQGYFGDVTLKPNSEVVVSAIDSTIGLPQYLDDSNEALCQSHISVPPCRTDACIVYAVSAELTYFAVPSTVSRDMCATAPVNPAITSYHYNTATGSTVIDNKTLYSNSAYVSLGALLAVDDDSCELGSVYTDLFLTFASSDVSSVRWDKAAEDYTYYPFNFADLNSPIPWSAWDYGYPLSDDTVTERSPTPILLMPDSLRTLDPLWAGCSSFFASVHDPPVALTTAGALIDPSSAPAAPASNPTPQNPPPTATAEPVTLPTTHDGPGSTQADKTPSTVTSAPITKSGNINPAESNSSPSPGQETGASLNNGGTSPQGNPNTSLADTQEQSDNTATPIAIATFGGTTISATPIPIVNSAADPGKTQDDVDDSTTDDSEVSPPTTALAYAIEGHTLSVGGPPATISDTIYTLGPNGIVVGSPSGGGGGGGIQLTTVSVPLSKAAAAAVGGSSSSPPGDSSGGELFGSIIEGLHSLGAESQGTRGAVSTATTSSFTTVGPAAYGGGNGDGEEKTLVLTLGGGRDPVTVTLDSSPQGGGGGVHVDGSATLELKGTAPAIVTVEGGVVLSMNAAGAIVAYTTGSAEAETSDMPATGDAASAHSTNSVSGGEDAAGATEDGASSSSGGLASATATESKNAGGSTGSDENGAAASTKSSESGTGKRDGGLWEAASCIAASIASLLLLP